MEFMIRAVTWSDLFMSRLCLTRLVQAATPCLSKGVLSGLASLKIVLGKKTSREGGQDWISPRSLLWQVAVASVAIWLQLVQLDVCGDLVSSKVLCQKVLLRLIRCFLSDGTFLRECFSAAVCFHIRLITLPHSFRRQERHWPRLLPATKINTETNTSRLRRLSTDNTEYVWHNFSGVAAFDRVEYEMNFWLSAKAAFQSSHSPSSIVCV